MGSLPEGTVTLLFSDVEGSTALLAEIGAEAYAQELEHHRLELRAAFARHGGSVVDSQGDAFFVAFPTATGACQAALEGQAALACVRMRVRMGIDTGELLATDAGYVGMTVHRAARVAAAGHGGQILVSEATRALVGDDVELHELGLHRLKDLAEPRRLYQLGDGSFPPPRSLNRSNLPTPTTPFIGRAPELDALVDLVCRPDVRLVTLTGPGGTGKTRLGLQAAAEAADDFPDGLTWVPLAAVGDPELVIEAVATALGIRPRDVGSGFESVAGALVDRTALLLLDNFEQVIEAARDVAALVDRCPRLTVLATSREPLQVSAEHVVLVDTLARSDAVALFSACAEAASASFEPSTAVAELCAKLDDLPLAIELAAARVRTLSIGALLERLGSALDLLKGGRDADPRQHTLRAAISWSYDLLNEDERRAFRRLGVFVDSCTLAAAEAICDADIEAISSLVDKSLVKRRRDAPGADRYWMLDTIRLFASERLAESGEQERLRERHAEWYARSTIEVGEQLFVQMGEGLDAISSDFNEIRRAIEYLDEAGRTELLAETVVYASLHWYFVADPREGLRWTRRALELRLPDRLLFRLENCLAMLLLFSDRTEAKLIAQRVIERDLELADPVEAVWAWTTLGNAHLSNGEPAAAEAAYDQAVQIAKRRGLSFWVEGLTSNMASAALGQGELDRAEALAGDASRSDNLIARTQGHSTIADIAIRRNDLATARASNEAAIREARAGWPVALLWCLRLMARIEAEEGAPERAAFLHGWVEAESRREGSPPDTIDAEQDAAIRGLIETRLGAGADRAARAAGSQLTGDEAAAVALGERGLPPLEPGSESADR
jgi:predicted ATPase/class 3 adenylate cyclase